MSRHRKNNRRINIYSTYEDSRFENIEWTKDTLTEMCDEYSFTYTFMGNYMFIKTNISTWYFSLEDTGGQMKLYHENLLRTSRSNKFSSDYHLQNKRFLNPPAAISYIYLHDKCSYNYMRLSKQQKQEYHQKKAG